MFTMPVTRASTAKPATYEGLQRLPEHMTGQIVDGELYASPRPAVGHARVSSVLGFELMGPFDRGRGGPGGWWIFDEPELHLAADVLVPDLAGWRKTRMPEPPAASESFVTLPPDWVCEVLSKSTESIDRQNKLPIYAAHGVHHVWLLDPTAKTLEVYTLDDERRWRDVRIYEGSARVRAEPFAEIELDMAELWA